MVNRLLQRRKTWRLIIFTNDNLTAYHISLFYPVLRIKRRSRTAPFDWKVYGRVFTCLVTSRVLNEGVDLPSWKWLSSCRTVLSGNMFSCRILRPSLFFFAQDTEEYTAMTSETCAYKWFVGRENSGKMLGRNYCHFAVLYNLNVRETLLHLQCI